MRNGGAAGLQGFHYGNRSSFFKMETHTCRVTARFTSVVAAALFVMGAAIPSLSADPVSELASFSAFPRADLVQFSQGEAKPVRSAGAGNARYLAVQTAYVVPVPPAAMLAKMRSWNPTANPQLNVYLHSESASDFSRLQNAPGNPAVSYLASATAQRSSDLQISAAEAGQLPPSGSAASMSGPVAAFWSRVLSARAQAFASGGSAAQPPYENSTPAVKPGDELAGLLRSQDKIRKHFSGLLEGTGIGRGRGTLKPDMFWELLSADQKGVLTLGAFYNRPGANGTIQTASALYYASGGYYAGVTLHQLWPVEVQGKPSTLVWRGDMISSASVGSLRGIERIAAESTMIRDISRVVSLFRRDTGSSR